MTKNKKIGRAGFFWKRRGSKRRRKSEKTAGQAEKARKWRPTREGPHATKKELTERREFFKSSKEGKGGAQNLGLRGESV